MKTSFYKLNKSLAKYTAIRVSNIGTSGYYGEIVDLGMNQYYDGKFEANIYTNSENQDIEIGGWYFSYHIEGRYHLPGSYKTTSFEINAIDPNGSEVTLYNTPYYQYFSESEVLCSFLNLITLHSKFEDGETAIKFYKLLRSIEGKHGVYRTIDKETNHEVGLTLAKEFREFYNAFQTAYLIFPTMKW